MSVVSISYNSYIMSHGKIKDKTWTEHFQPEKRMVEVKETTLSCKENTWTNYFNRRIKVRYRLGLDWFQCIATPFHVNCVNGTSHTDRQIEWIPCFQVTAASQELCKAEMPLRFCADGHGIMATLADQSWKDCGILSPFFFFIVVIDFCFIFDCLSY